MNLTELSEKHRKHQVIPLLIAIFLLGFAIRYLARGPRIGPELDTWFHYRVVRYILDTGGVPNIDPLAYYPTGRPLRSMDLLGLPMFIAYTYKIAGITGITLMDYMVAFPAIFTSLAAVPLYLLTKEILNKKTGLLAALFWQIIPSTLTRTHAGFVDKETLASVYIFLWLWFFIRSGRALDIQDNKTLALPVLSGIFLGLSSWTWGGTGYFVLVISTSTFLYFILNYRTLKSSLGYTLILMTVFGALTLKLVQPLHFPIKMFYSGFIYTSLTAVSLLYGLLLLKKYFNAKLDEKNSNKAMALVILLMLGGGMISGLIPRVYGGFAGLLRSRILRQKSLVGATVSENLSPNFPGDWISHFDVLLYIAPLGLLLMLLRYKEKKDYSSMFVLFFALSGALGMRSDIRLSFALTPSIAILSSYAVFYFLTYFREKEAELKNTLTNSKKQKIRYKAETQLSYMKLGTVFTLIVLIGIISAPTVSSYSMLNGRKVDVPVPWYNAMIWISDNTPTDSVIISWWDYGYWIQALGKRRTVVDGGNSGPRVHDTKYTEGLEYRGSDYHRDVDIAKMFTSQEVEALKYLRPYVDYEKVPTYVLVSYEEFGKSGAINSIAQDGLYIFPQRIPNSGDTGQDSQVISDFINNNGIETFTVINFGSSYQLWFTGFAPMENNGRVEYVRDASMKNKLLAKLLPFQNTGFGQGLEHFELVYNDDINYVLIYKIV